MQHAQAAPDCSGLISLDRHGHVNEALSRGDLDHRLRVMASGLRERVAPGARVLVVASNPAIFLCSVLATLRAGAVAVPCSCANTPYGRERRARVVYDCEPALILADDSAAAQSIEDHPAIPIISVGELQDAPQRQEVENEILPRESGPAYLQYTSGSTGSPRGAIITHENLAANIDQIAEAFHLRQSDRFGIWLPLYHDMGLVSTFAGLSVGAPIHLSQPSIIADPVSWLRTISRHEITVSGGPEFAFRAAARPRLRERAEGIDLSSWRLAFTGAEPIRRATLETFAETWAESGFSKEAFAPTYGLAEATLVVATAGPSGFEADPLTGTVCCGRPVSGSKIRIVDPATGEVVAGGTVGEICIAGPQVAAGYHQRRAADEDLGAHGRFSRSLPGASNSECFFRTGDLGWLNSDGALFVKGRLDGLLIVNGENLAPEDVERALTDLPACAEGITDVAAAAYRGGYAMLLELRKGQETRPDWAAEVLERIEAAGFPPPEAVFCCPRGTLRRTMSGKLVRAAIAEDLASNRLDVEWIGGRAESHIACSEDWTRLDALLHADMVLDTRPVGDEQRLSALGLNSIERMALASRMRAHLGIDLSPADLSTMTVGTLRSALRAAKGARRLPRAELPGPRPLGPLQLRILAEARSGSDRSANTIALIFTLPEPQDWAETMRQILAVLDGACLKLQSTGARSELLPVSAEEITAVTRRMDQSTGPGPAFLEAAQAPLSLESGLAVELLIGENRSGLACAFALRFHHIAFDLRSAELVVARLCRAAPRRVTELRSVSQMPASAESSIAVEKSGAPQPHSYTAPHIPGRLPDGGVDPCAARTVRRLDGWATARLDRTAAALGLSRFDFLAAAFFLALRAASMEDAFSVVTVLQSPKSPTSVDEIGFHLDAIRLDARVRPDSCLAEVAAQLRHARLAGRCLDPDAAHEVFFVQEELLDLDSGLLSLFMSERGSSAAFGDMILHVPPLRHSTVPLVARVARAGDEQMVAFDYLRAAWADGLVEGLLASYVALIDAICTNPAAPLRCLRTPTSERLSRQPRETPTSLPERIYYRALETPNRPAIIEPDRSTSYAELLASAEQVREALGPAVRGRVLVLQSNSVRDLAVVSMAAWMREASILALDPAQPDAETATVLAAAKPACVVHRGVTLLDGALLNVAQRLDLCALRPIQPPFVSTPPYPRPVTAMPAYVMLTSGTTGVPSLVLGAHGALAEHCAEVAAIFDWRPQDRVLRVSPVSFDAILEEVHAALWAGIPVIDAGRLLDRGFADFDAALSLYRPSVINIPTPFWDRWIRNMAREGRHLHKDLRLVVIGNTAFFPDAFHAWKAVGGGGERGPRLLDAYGPTEATATAAFRALRGDCAGWPRIGPNPRSLSVLDAAGRPAPHGVFGEVCISGDALALGYLNDARATAQTFLPDPDSPVAGSRRLMTGDLGQIDGSGRLQLKGRMRGFLKIRGQRVEPQAVETALRLGDGVSDAIALALPIAEEDALVAVAECTNPAAVDPAALRRSVAARLPRSHHPDVVLARNAFPRGASGKVDWRSVRDWALGQIRGKGSVVEAALSPFEARVAREWREVLKHSAALAPDSDFFDLGGHSLSAMSLVARYESLFGVEVEMRLLFDMPRLADQAAYLEAALKARLAEMNESDLRRLAGDKIDHD